MRSLAKRPHFWPSQRLKKVLFTAQNCSRLRTGLIITQIPRGYQKKSLFCRKARYVRSLGKNPPFWPSQRLRKVLFTAQGCARLRTGLKITQIPRGYQKKKFIVSKSAICAILSEKSPFLAFLEAKKGVVHCARLRKAAHWPKNNANPFGAIRKKSLLCRKARYVRSIAKRPHFWPSQRLKKVLFTAQGCARLRTGVKITQIPRGYQKKSLLCRKARYVRSLAKKPHFMPSQRLKKVLFTAQGCSRLRTDLIITQIPRG